MSAWNQGRTEVDALLAQGRLQRVAANREHAAAIVVMARKVVGTMPVY